MKSLWMNETRLNHLLKVVELCIDADSFLEVADCTWDLADSSREMSDSNRGVSDAMYEVADYCENH